MKNRLVSIIIPVYNSEKFLCRCLDSILAQTYKNIEVLLIDDGSTDKSGKICDEYAKKDKRIITIHIKNGGVSHARNLAIEKSKGEYITFVDSDDYVDENYVKIMLDYIIKFDADISICGIAYQKRNKAKNNSSKTNIKIIDKEEYALALYTNANILGFVWNKLYSSKIIKKNIIKFEENISMLEDELFNFKIIDNYNELKCVVLSNKLYYYVMNDLSAVHQFNIKSISIFDSYEKIIDILKKNNINYNGIMAQYIISAQKLKYLTNKSKINCTNKYISITTKCNEFKRKIKIKKIINNKLKMKYIVALYFPFLYKINIYLRKSNSII